MAHDALIKKFGGVRLPENRTRRFDYKGTRKRINLRITEELAVNLQVIKLASGEDKNTFCERALKTAIDTLLAELKAKHDQAAWETLIKVARRAQRP